MGTLKHVYSDSGKTRLLYLEIQLVVRLMGRFCGGRSV